MECVGRHIQKNHYFDLPGCACPTMCVVVFVCGVSVVFELFRCLVLIMCLWCVVSVVLFCFV